MFVLVLMRKLIGCRNYSSAFIMGSTNLRSSAFRDHGKSDMHQYAMHLLKKSCSKHITEYAPIILFVCFAIWMMIQRA